MRQPYNCVPCIRGLLYYREMPKSDAAMSCNVSGIVLEFCSAAPPPPRGQAAVCQLLLPPKKVLLSKLDVMKVGRFHSVLGQTPPYLGTLNCQFCSNTVREEECYYSGFGCLSLEFSQMCSSADLLPQLTKPSTTQIGLVD